MKPINLCLIHVGKKGLELVGSHPKSLPTEIMNQILLKSMPFGAKPGDFLTTSTGNNCFSGFVFRVPSNIGRDNLATIMAIFDSEDYNPNSVKKLFSTILEKLQENDLVKMETMVNLLPEMYRGMSKGYLKLKISSVVTLEFDFKSEDKERDQTERKVSDIRRELWR